MESISSLQNPRIKNIVKLIEKARERKEQKVFVAEGYREIWKAVRSGFKVREVYCCPEVSFSAEVQQLIDELQQTSKCFEVSKEAFDKIAYRENSDGLLALIEPRQNRLTDIKLPENPLILVVESVEKPGNLGAILRTADAAALDAVVVCNPQTDVYNPNVIRSSLGCIFTQQVAVCTTSEAIDFFGKLKIKTFAAALTATKYYHETTFTEPTAIVMGTEADGLSEEWLTGADMQIKIPMSGMADSLNVSTSAAILVFEAKRQRWIL